MSRWHWKDKSFVSRFLSQLSATFDNALTGLSYLNSNKVDMLFWILTWMDDRHRTLPESSGSTAN